MHSCHMLDYLHICIRIHQTGAGTELNTCTKQWSMFRNTTDMQHTIPLINSAIYTQQCISTLSQGIHTHPTHVHTHTHTATHTRTHMHTHAPTQMHLHTHSTTLACTHVHMPTHAHIHTRIYMHTYTHPDFCNGHMQRSA